MMALIHFRSPQTFEHYLLENGCFPLGPRGYVSLNEWNCPQYYQVPKRGAMETTYCLPTTCQKDTIHHATDKRPLLTHTHQFWLSCIKPKSPKSFVFITFSTVSLHACTCKCRSYQPTYNCTLKMPQSSHISF